MILAKWEVLDDTLCFHWQLCVLYCTCVKTLVVRAFGHLINLRAINLVSVSRVDDVLAGTCLVRVTTMLPVNSNDIAGHVMFMFRTYCSNRHSHSLLCLVNVDASGVLVKVVATVVVWFWWWRIVVVVVVVFLMRCCSLSPSSKNPRDLFHLSLFARKSRKSGVL